MDHLFKLAIVWLFLMSAVHIWAAEGEISNQAPMIKRWDFRDSKPLGEAPEEWFPDCYPDPNMKLHKNNILVNDDVVLFTTRANSSDKIKIATEASFTVGTYKWHVYIPPVTDDAVSVGAFIYQNDNRELDFEIGPGPKDIREKCDIPNDCMTCYMTKQKESNIIDKDLVVCPIRPGWHELSLVLTLRSNHNYVVSWKIDGVDPQNCYTIDGKNATRKNIACEFGPDTTQFRIVCSLENYWWIGASAGRTEQVSPLPKTDHTAEFDWVSVSPEEGNNNNSIMKVNAVLAVVKQGSQIRFEGSVTDALGVPQPNVQVAVQDPIRQQSVAGEPSLKTNSEGKFSYAVSTQLTKSGVYSFVFWAADLPGQIVAVCVCEAGAAPGGHYLNIDVPLGSWGAIGEGYSQNSGLFVPTARMSTSRTPTTTGMIPPSSADEMVRRSKELGNANIGYWRRFANEFAGNPVNDIAVPAAIVSCPFPDVTVSKAVCAASLTYLAVSVSKTAFYAGMKQWIAESDRTAEEKQQAMVMVDAGNAIASAIMLDPESGLAGFSEASLAWKTRKTYMEFVNLPVGTGASVPTSSAKSPWALNLTVTFKDSAQVMNVTLIPIPPPTPVPGAQGMLDVVIVPYSCGPAGPAEVKEEFRKLHDSLALLGKEQAIDIHMGFVGFYPAGSEKAFGADVLSADWQPTREDVNELKVTNALKEDLYSGMMYAMDQSVGDESVHMGWRPGAAKMLFPIAVDLPFLPKRFTSEQVAQTAHDLDPVHIYPLVFPLGVPLEHLPFFENLAGLASKTGGEVINVRNTKNLHESLLKAVKLSIRQHKEEVWRKANPPYLLYSLGIAVAVIAVLGIAGLFAKSMRRPRWATEFVPDADPRLSGEPLAKARQRDERSTATADPRLSGQTRHRRDPQRKD